jgi:hypothetical protein
VAIGKKYGGRVKGTPNRSTLRRQEAIARLQLESKDPLSFFMAIMKDPQSCTADKIMAAKELLPYMHPKLSSIEARTGGMTHEERLKQINAMLEAEGKDPQGG